MSTPARVVVRNYTGQLVGMTAWLLQRVTGLLLLFYLFLHVETIHQLSAGQAAFDRQLAFYSTPFFKLLEIGLLATVILHAFNGIRLTVLDLGIAHGRQRKLFWVLVVSAGAALFIAGAVPIFVFSVLQR
ncbi:MAG TPA: succinate dehydrogenase, cytochrome b556 subunit [Terriglobales bacterium]|nr:succinate dehydrogenase, cytochrome b556 subunit [Terriglobales bacterium]